ncbi:MAG: PAS domain-containing protein [Coxiellaceae bacterium]|jgi:PAS domain S-box-containing protein|nr:PAS domain-containing protein [Coxiellaceae bacterium]
MDNKTNTLEYLEKIADIVPVAMYWFDIDQKYLGVNKFVVEGTGKTSCEKDFANKTPYDIYPKKVAEDIVQHNKEAIRTKRTVVAEEKIVTDKVATTKYLNAFISPLYDDSNKEIIGTIGISVDITAEKEASRLNIFASLERFSSLIPAPISWLDLNGIVIGLNVLAYQNIGAAASGEVVIGKTLYDLYPRDVAEILIKHTLRVIQEERALLFEEVITDITTKKTRYFLSTRAPLFDDDKHIIGVICTSLEVTDSKEAECLRIESEKHKVKLREQEKFRKLVDQAAHDVQSPLAVLLIVVQSCIGLAREEVYETIEKFSDIVPVPLCWVNENNAILGANKLNLEAIGGTTVEVGKTAYDILPYEMADVIVKHNNLVMHTGKVLSQEEQIRDFTTGKTKYFTEFKAPLYDKDGKIIGILGTAVDITTEKNAERLKLETESQKIKLAEQDKFKKVADQVVHDIRSPLASLAMMLKVYDKNIPEQIRIPLRDAAANISDIASNLLNRYEKGGAVPGVEEQQPVMVSLVLSQLLSDKRYQYKEINVKFTSKFSRKCIFTFIKVQPSIFRRMLSNLVNNAVEALEGKKGTVHLDLSLDKDKDKVKIIIQDNGKGMSKEIIDKILSNDHVATDKRRGHGIGLTQILDTIKNNQSKLIIKSKLGEGSRMILTFPKIEAPDWIAKKIKVNKGDTIIILDDDRSMHGAWDYRFKDFLSGVRVKHFLIGNRAVDFINAFPEKEKIFLLTDYELLKQDINGIDIIMKTNMKRSILVTSHYAEVELRNTAIKNGIKMLPKQLTSDVPLEICEAYAR